MVSGIHVQKEYYVVEYGRSFALSLSCSHLLLYDRITNGPCMHAYIVRAASEVLFVVVYLAVPPSSCWSTLCACVDSLRRLNSPTGTIFPGQLCIIFYHNRDLQFLQPYSARDHKHVVHHKEGAGTPTSFS